jgi:metal-dependent HD superfamily phosphatase/phosphodiesterase
MSDVDREPDDGPSSDAGDPASGEDTTGVEHYDPVCEHDFPDERVNRVLDVIAGDDEVQALIEAQNVNPVQRKGYNDHGPKHVRIVRDRALQLYDLLKCGSVSFNGARQHEDLEEADEAVIVALAATLHDVGHVVHRDQHPYYSVPVASDVLDRLLPAIYDTAPAVKIKGEILHAILCHHTPEEPLTLEAGVVRVADALDMEHGRSREPYEQGGRGINTLSSQAIQAVSLREGEDRPVLVEIEMTNAAGVYQVDNLLKAKLRDSKIEDFVRIVALNVAESEGERLVERIEL